MKGLKLQPIVLCVALAPVPVLAEIQPLNEAQMNAVTGQAGVTIELETKLDLGNTGSGSGTGGASTVTGPGVLPDYVGAGDDAGITVDLETRVDIGRFIYVDEGALTIDNIEIGGAGRVDQFSELGNLTSGAPSDLLDDVRMTIDVLDEGDALVNIRPQTGLAIDLGVRTGQWALRGNNDSTVILDGFYMDALVSGATIAVDTASDTLYLGAGIAVGDLGFDADFISFGVRGFKLTGADYDPTSPSPDDLFADVGIFLFHGQRASGESALAVEIPQFDADITIDSVLLGGTSIGSVGLDNLSISNTSMRVYGH